MVYYLVAIIICVHKIERNLSELYNVFSIIILSLYVYEHRLGNFYYNLLIKFSCLTIVHWCGAAIVLPPLRIGM